MPRASRLLRVVADTHALVWYLNDTTDLPASASQVLGDACDSDGVVVPTGVLLDLWYVVNTTGALSNTDLALVEDVLADPTRAVDVDPLNLETFNAWKGIDVDVLRDPWDRMIVASAIVHDLPLVTRDHKITGSRLVEVIW